jgi:hypothetical protein
MARFNPRYFGVVGISGCLFTDLLRLGGVKPNVVRCVKGLPRDARIEMTQYDPGANIVWIVVSSATPFTNIQDVSQFGLPLLEIQYSTEEGVTLDV